MGWSASVACASIPKRDAMVAFMEQHYRDSSAVLLTGLRSRSSGLLVGGGIKYGAGKLKVGFNSPHDYEYALLRWMALRVGMRRRFLVADHPVPWLNLDAKEAEPLLLNTDVPEPTSKQAQLVVDSHGYRPLDRFWLMTDPEAEQLELRVSRREKLIEAELHRLSEMWGDTR